MKTSRGILMSLATFFALSCSTHDDPTAAAASGSPRSRSSTATELVVAQQPGGLAAGGHFTVSVEIRDEDGVRVRTATDPIPLSIASGESLTGSVVVHAVAGVAAFTDLRMEKA